MKNRKFKIGDKVLYNNKEHLIVAYFKGNPYVHYAIKGPEGIHFGTLDEAILEDGSPYCPIIKSYDHLYVGENDLTLIEDNKMERSVKLSLEDAKKLYEQGGNFRTIALGAYSEDELVFTPKDGDFIYVESKYSENSFIYIKEDGEYKTSRYISYNIRKGYLFYYGNPVVFNDEEISFIRLATEEEKQQLIEAMHKEGKDWDPINKKIIPYRWRAKLNENYYYVVDFSECKAYVTKSIEDDCKISNGRFEKHNYFKTKEEAQKVADKINHIFEEL